ncbi:MAG: hypothetical protein ACRDA5_14045 [Clostridium sp.]
MKVYDEMTIEEVVNHFEIELARGRSAKEIEIVDFGVSERVIRKRLSRKGIKIDKSKIDNKSITTVIKPEKDNYRSNTPVIKTKESNNKSITSVINEVIDVKAINELTSLMEPLKELLQKYHNSNYIIDIELNEFNVQVAKDVKSKVFKIDVNVLAQLDEFCSLYPQYKLQDIISTLLLEAISKYK